MHAWAMDASNEYEVGNELIKSKRQATAWSRINMKERNRKRMGEGERERERRRTDRDSQREMAISRMQLTYRLSSGRNKMTTQLSQQSVLTIENES